MCICVCDNRTPCVRREALPQGHTETLPTKRKKQKKNAVKLYFERRILEFAFVLNDWCS